MRGITVQGDVCLIDNQFVAWVFLKSGAKQLSSKIAVLGA